MNLQFWRGELEIFNTEQVLHETDESLLHGWMSNIDGREVFIFCIGEDCELTSRDVNGKTAYAIERKVQHE